MSVRSLERAAHRPAPSTNPRSLISSWPSPSSTHFGPASVLANVLLPTHFHPFLRPHNRTRPHALMPTRPLSPPIATRFRSHRPHTPAHPCSLMSTGLLPTHFSTHCTHTAWAHAHQALLPTNFNLRPCRPHSPHPFPSISLRPAHAYRDLPGPFPHLFPSRSPILVRLHPPHTFAQISRSRLTEQTRTQGSKILLGIRVPQAPLFNDVQNHLLHCTVSYNFDID